MERHSHEELRALTTRLADLGALVESRTRDALTALFERRSDLAVQVASGDAAVNQLELEIDDRCIRFLATQSPVASDLRLVRSVLKVITDLERVGDQAVNMAHTIIGLLAMPPLRPILDVSLLGETALQMLHDGITSAIRSSGSC
jgi:phosphate transport system protein